MDAAEHSTAALSVTGPSALAIVLAGIASTDKLTQHYEKLQKSEKEQGNHFPANYFERAGSEQSRQYYQLLEVLPYLPATDLVEATAQVAQAMNVINQTYDDLPDTEEVNRPFKKMEAAVDRLLHSAVRALEKAGGFSLVDMGLSSIRNANLDPWADVETVVVQLRKEGV